MRKFILATTLGLTLCAAYSFSATRSAMLQQDSQIVTVQDSDADQAALNELNNFAAAHQLIGGYRDGSEDGTFDLALFTADENGDATGDGPKWVVYGAATLTEGVVQIESDYKTYPDGHNVDPDANGKA
jgi:hypothetical protein